MSGFVGTLGPPPLTPGGRQPRCTNFQPEPATARQQRAASRLKRWLGRSLGLGLAGQGGLLLAVEWLLPFGNQASWSVFWGVMAGQVGLLVGLCWQVERGRQLLAGAPPGPLRWGSRAWLQLLSKALGVLAAGTLLAVVLGLVGWAIDSAPYTSWFN